VNPVTGQTYAFFEPTIDYVVSKIPRWPFDKFVHANRKLGTQMKATGEVMGIGRTLEESLLKSVRSLEIGVHRLFLKDAVDLDDETLKQRLVKPDDERLFLLAEAFRRGWDLLDLQDLTKIDWWFLRSVQSIVRFENRLRVEALTPELLKEAKRMGFTDRAVAELRKEGGYAEIITESEVRTLRLSQGLKPVYKMVDTCAAEFEAST